MKWCVVKVRGLREDEMVENGFDTQVDAMMAAAEMTRQTNSRHKAVGQRL